MGARLYTEIAVVLALLVALGTLGYQNNSLKADLAKCDTQVAARDTAITKQNGEISLLKADAETMAARADSAARAALLAGERRRAKLPTGHGPAVMNEWLRETFGAPP